MIKEIDLQKEFDSRGDPTLKATVITDKGSFSGSAPSGKSKGKYEAFTLPISKSIKSAKQVASNWQGMEEDFWMLDNLLQDLAGKRFKALGSRAGFALSSAALKASTKGKPWKLLGGTRFPLPLGNVVGGGAHGGTPAIQEFLIIPLRVKSIEEAIKRNIKVHLRVKKELLLKGQFCGKNDENAWISRLDDLETLDFLASLCEEYNCSCGLDIAASEIWSKGKYSYQALGKEFDEGEQLEFVLDLIKTYKLSYIEDPFREEDFSSFAELSRKSSALICADDLTATNEQRLKKALAKKACSAVVIKPNQVGTIGLALKTAKLAARKGIKLVISHRSGETLDWIIADLAVGLEAPLIKTGICGGERMAKLNRLLELWTKVPSPSIASLD